MKVKLMRAVKSYELKDEELGSFYLLRFKV